MLEDTEGALGKKNEESVEQKKENIREEKERSRSKERSTRKHKEKKGRELFVAVTFSGIGEGGKKGNGVKGEGGKRGAKRGSR